MLCLYNKLLKTRYTICNYWDGCNWAYCGSHFAVYRYIKSCYSSKTNKIYVSYMSVNIFLRCTYHEVVTF